MFRILYEAIERRIDKKKQLRNLDSALFYQAQGLATEMKKFGRSRKLEQDPDFQQVIKNLYVLEGIDQSVVKLLEKMSKIAELNQEIKKLNQQAVDDKLDTEKQVKIDHLKVLKQQIYEDIEKEDLEGTFKVFAKKDEIKRKAYAFWSLLKSKL